MSRFFKLEWKFLILCILLLAACHKSDPGEELRPVVDRTVLIYMAADNSLNNDASDNIYQMLQGMSEMKGRVVIYLDQVNDKPRLLTMHKEVAVDPVLLDTVVIDTLKTYEEENSASPGVLSRVISETQALFPGDSYGLILWSHGMSWLPENYSFPGAYSLQRTVGEVPRTKYFGEDWHLGADAGKYYMSIEELAEAIPDQTFDFILFDACFMSSIEVLYELHSKADYLIASPAEVVADGFPYNEVMPHLWGDEYELKLMCEAFYNYYNAHPKGGQWQSATVAMVRTAELEELMAQTRNILQGKMESVVSGGYSDVWSYPLSTSALPDVFYDFREYIRKVGNGTQLEAFEKQLEKTVIYKKATSSLFAKEIPRDKYSGITTYIPQQQWNAMNDVYRTLSWTEAVY